MPNQAKEGVFAIAVRLGTVLSGTIPLRKTYVVPGEFREILGSDTRAHHELLQALRTALGITQSSEFRITMLPDWFTSSLYTDQIVADCGTWGRIVEYFNSQRRIEHPMITTLIMLTFVRNFMAAVALEADPPLPEIDLSPRR